MIMSVKQPHQVCKCVDNEKHVLIVGFAAENCSLFYYNLIKISHMICSLFVQLLVNPGVNLPYNMLYVEYEC